MENKEIKILPLLYDLILWYSGKFSKYPKKFKYNLGERVMNCFLDIIEDIISAQYSKQKNHFLRRANLTLEKLRLLIRLSKDLECISIQEYEYAIRQANEIGKMVGGWEKFSKGVENGE
jgi:hypothetical protein